MFEVLNTVVFEVELVETFKVVKRLYLKDVAVWDIKNSERSRNGSKGVFVEGKLVFNLLVSQIKLFKFSAIIKSIKSCYEVFFEIELFQIDHV